VVLLITWVLVGLVVGAYIWFVVWRFKAEKRKKAAEAAAEEPMKAALRSTSTSVPAEPPAVHVASAPMAQVDPIPSPAPVERPAPPSGSVVAALSGIELPADLVPLTTMAPRAGVGDRVAFWTNSVPPEIVGPAFAEELRRLGYEVTPLDASSLAARRDDTRLVVVTHPDSLLATIGDQPAFPSLPEHSVVVETWLTD
jgi:hypothetical protein